MCVLIDAESWFLVIFGELDLGVMVHWTIVIVACLVLEIQSAYEEGGKYNDGKN